MKYRKILSTDENIFPEFDPNHIRPVPYNCNTLLDEDEVFFVADARSQPYAIDLMQDRVKTEDYNQLTRSEFSDLDFLFVVREDTDQIFFQKTPKSKRIKKQIVLVGDSFTYLNDSNEISIHDRPDAIYDFSSNILYFYKLETITSIFNTIDQLYKEASKEETEAFLQQSFLSLQNGFSADQVKTANRKRIAIASKLLANLTSTQRDKMITYIGDYCPNLLTPNRTFSVESDSQLKLLLYGIEERFYTTAFSTEKRLANSVIRL